MAAGLHVGAVALRAEPTLAKPLTRALAVARRGTSRKWMKPLGQPPPDSGEPGPGEVAVPAVHGDDHLVGGDDPLDVPDVTGGAGGLGSRPPPGDRADARDAVGDPALLGPPVGRVPAAGPGSRRAHAGLDHPVGGVVGAVVAREHPPERRVAHRGVPGVAHALRGAARVAGAQRRDRRVGRGRRQGDETAADGGQQRCRHGGTAGAMTSSSGKHPCDCSDRSTRE